MGSEEPEAAQTGLTATIIRMMTTVTAGIALRYGDLSPTLVTMGGRGQPQNRTEFMGNA